MKIPLTCAIPIALLGAASTAAGQGQSVVDTKHNLSVSGPGAIRAASEQQVCIFCHTSHRAAPIQPLWNRSSPVNAYQVYGSSSLDATPGQPTGASKMCLSCHDGTIALGSVLSRDDVIRMAGGITTLPAGSSANLGTDLSDDHPVSFAFSASLAVQDRALMAPFQLPQQVKLDERGEMQCTTCHDPHDNSFGNFLVMSNQDSALCVTCHTIADTTIQEHTQCVSCHREHSAPSGPLLLAAATTDETCLACHDGSQPRAQSILADLQKLSAHDTSFGPRSMDVRADAEVSCADCHDPHTMDVGGAGETGIAPNFGRVSGVSASGAAVQTATFEYEVCYKCHADFPGNVMRSGYVPRVLTQINTRLEFLPSAISFHPVQAPGRNSDVPSLRSGWSTSSVVKCSDCHGSDTAGIGGGGARGVHGSNEPPLLVARYETTDYTTESATAYALCYRCHDREGATGVLSDASFPHRVHVVDNQTSCATCHDAHGIASAQGSLSENSHLINFDSSVVFPAPNGRLEFRDMGTFAGSCTLSCHGVTHDRIEYER